MSAITISVVPESSNTAFVTGLPGLSSFTVSGNVRIENTTPKQQPVDISSVTLKFLGQSESFPSNLGAIASEVIKHSKKLEHIVESAELLSKQVSIPANSTKVFPFCFNIPGIAEGGPIILPPSGNVTKPAHIETFYDLYASVVRVKKTFFGSTTKTYPAHVAVPFRSFDLRFPAVVSYLTGNLPSPSPGFEAGKPVNLPSNAIGRSEQVPGLPSISFPQGLCLPRGRSIPMSITSTSELKSIHVRIKQYMTAFSIAVQNGLIATTNNVTHNFDITVSDFTVDRDILGQGSDISIVLPATPDVLPTRVTKVGDPTVPFNVIHKMKIDLNMTSGTTIHLETPVIIMDLGVDDMVGIPPELVFETASRIPQRQIYWARGILSYPLTPDRQLTYVKPPVLVNPNQKVKKIVTPPPSASSLVGGQYIEDLDVLLDSEVFDPTTGKPLSGRLVFDIAKDLEGASSLTLHLQYTKPKPNGTFDVIPIPSATTTIWDHGTSETRTMHEGIHEYPFSVPWPAECTDDGRYTLRVVMERAPTAMPAVTHREGFKVVKGSASMEVADALPTYEP